jgi:2-succinyl-5-enolpyruvyl-6-hydroxy-3-cyclohexene-1-carboxylate synthase
MAVALASDERVRVHVHLDERSGAFTALGLAMASGRPVPVLTTSGTAAVELHPAVVEAFYAAVPLIALTADRPPELQDVGAPQTIDQRDLFGESVSQSFELQPPDDVDPTFWRLTAADVWRAASRRFVAGLPQGPVHVNLAFREPLLGDVGELPPASPAEPEAPSVPDAPWVPELVDELAGRRVLVLAGGGIEDPAGVLALAEVAGWPVLADPRSGCRRPSGTTVAHPDALLRHPGFAEDEGVRPDVVLRLGRPWASKVLHQWLAGLGVPQTLVEATGLPADPDRVVGRTIWAEPGDVCRRVLAAGVAPAPSAWLDRWVTADRATAAAIAAEVAHLEATAGQLSEPGVARTVVDAAPDGATLVVSSSMPVRDVEWYSPVRSGLRVLSNRGANGIDGVLSTAVGAALDGGPTLALVGDLAFLHDTNGLLGAAGRGIDLTVVVVDNDGGGIFSFLPPAAALEVDRYEQLFGTPHGLDVAAVAEAHGAPAVRVRTEAELRAALEARVGGGVQVVVADVGGRDANVAAHDAIHRAVADSLMGGSPA